MTDQEIQKRMALLLGWVKNTGEKGTVWPWTLPGGSHSLDRDLPPWPTDDGTALKALEEWCDDNDLDFRTWRPAQGKHHVCLEETVGGSEVSYKIHQSLARAICEAMIAACSAVAEAHKSMEGTKHE